MTSVLFVAMLLTADQFSRSMFVSLAQTSLLGTEVYMLGDS